MSLERMPAHRQETVFPWLEEIWAVGGGGRWYLFQNYRWGPPGCSLLFPPVGRAPVSTALSSACTRREGWRSSAMRKQQSAARFRVLLRHIHLVQSPGTSSLCQPQGSHLSPILLFFLQHIGSLISEVLPRVSCLQLSHQKSPCGQAAAEA